jgi:serine protease AprX
VSLSVGAALLIIGADAALNWVLENHAAPCGAGAPA